MNKNLAPDRLTTHSHRLVTVISYLLIVVVGLRRSYDLVGIYNVGLLLVLLGIFTVLFSTESRLSAKIKFYPWIYFSIQMIIVQILGVFQEYQDTWAALYIPLGFQAAVRCPRKAAMIWFSLFVTSTLVTLSVEFGLVSGPGRALAYVVIGVLLISYDIQYAQHEDTLTESQMLLEELKDAHDKLQNHAAQAERLAAVHERNQRVQELFDSVGQEIFAIQLAAEAIRLIVENDPQGAAEQMDNLQVQTQSALNQMRQLIEQWRPA